MQTQERIDYFGALKRIDECMRAGMLEWDYAITVDVHVELAMYEAVGVVPDAALSVELALQMLTDEIEPEETVELALVRQMLASIC